MTLNSHIAPADAAQRDVNRLTRGEVETALNWAGYATYDHESTDDLGDALATGREMIGVGAVAAEAAEVAS